MLYISIFCIFCRFFCLLTIKIFFPPKKTNIFPMNFANPKYQSLSDNLWKLLLENTIGKYETNRIQFRH